LRVLEGRRSVVEALRIDGEEVGCGL